MGNYTDFNFYRKTFKGDMPLVDFEKIVMRASAEVRKNIFNRDITGYEDEVQMATCSVADILYKIEQIEKKKSKLISSAKEDKVLASIGVGDLNKTFANTNKIADLDLEISNQKSKIIEEISLYLCNTGLLYRGI